jgi:predicted methyltransferase
LIDLIGDSLKEEFYSEAKEQSTKNYNDGNDVTLTRQQLIDIVVKLKKTHQNNTSEKVINKIFQNTKYGLIYLN